MKLKGTLVVVGALVSGAALAQEAVQSEKVAPLQTLFPSAYGRVEVRHTTAEKYNTTTDEANVIPTVTARPTLGSTFFNDKLDVAATWIFAKTADNPAVKKAALYGEATYQVFKNENFNVYPYLYTAQAFGDSFSVVMVGPHLEATQAFELGAGRLTLTAFTEPLAEFYSARTANRTRSRLENAGALSQDTLGLVGADDNQEIARRDPAFVNITEGAVRFMPAVVPGLTIAGAVDYLQDWQPKYTVSEADAGVELDGYDTKTMVLNKFTVSYKIRDGLTVANQARYGVAGFYESTYDSSMAVYAVINRFENRIILSASLF